LHPAVAELLVRVAVEAAGVDAEPIESQNKRIPLKYSKSIIDLVGAVAPGISSKRSHEVTQFRG
jgi:hypothetical protein